MYKLEEPEILKNSTEENEITEENIANKFNAALIVAMERVNASPKGYEKGVWEYHDYAEYCEKNGKPLELSLVTGFANPEFWQKSPGFFTHKIKLNVKPSAAVTAFLTGFTVADCGNILYACLLYALLEVIGEEKFNRIFHRNPIIISPAYYKGDDFALFFEKNPTNHKGTIGDRGLIKGNICHIASVSFVKVKKPASHTGWNVIYVGKNDNNEDIFLGFGPKIFTKPLTEKEIYQVLVEIYNLERDCLDLAVIGMSQDYAQYDMKQQDTPNQISVSDIPGYLAEYTMSTDFAEIKKLVMADLTDVTPEWLPFKIFEKSSHHKQALAISEMTRWQQQVVPDFDVDEYAGLKKNDSSIGERNRKFKQEIKNRLDLFSSVESQEVFNKFIDKEKEIQEKWIKFKESEITAEDKWDDPAIIEKFHEIFIEAVMNFPLLLIVIKDQMQQENLTKPADIAARLTDQTKEIELLYWLMISSLIEMYHFARGRTYYADGRNHLIVDKNMRFHSNARNFYIPDNLLNQCRLGLNKNMRLFYNSFGGESFREAIKQADARVDHWTRIDTSKNQKDFCPYPTNKPF